MDVYGRYVTLSMFFVLMFRVQADGETIEVSGVIIGTPKELNCTVSPDPLNVREISWWRQTEPTVDAELLAKIDRKNDTQTSTDENRLIQRYNKDERRAYLLIRYVLEEDTCPTCAFHCKIIRDDGSQYPVGEFFKLVSNGSRILNSSKPLSLQNTTAPASTSSTPGDLPPMLLPNTTIQPTGSTHPSTSPVVPGVSTPAKERPSVSSAEGTENSLLTSENPTSLHTSRRITLPSGAVKTDDVTTTWDPSVSTHSPNTGSDNAPEESLQQGEGDGLPLFAIIGGVGGFIVLLATVIIVIVVVIRRRRASGSEKRESAFSETPYAVYTTTDVSHLDLPEDTYMSTM